MNIYCSFCIDLVTCRYSIERNLKDGSVEGGGGGGVECVGGGWPV